MRSLIFLSLCSSLCLLSAPGNAGDISPSRISVSAQSANPSSEEYRGHSLDLSALAGRQEFPEMVGMLRHQVDIVEDISGLSPNLLDFFRSIPISVNEEACLELNKDSDGKDIEKPKALLHAACYGPILPESSRGQSYGSVWDSGQSRWINSDPVALGVVTNLGVIMVRPIMLRASSPEANRPVLVHELLHAYHRRMMSQGYKNAGVLLHYKLAKDAQLYPVEAYMLTNEREFFAVTASVFLSGNDGTISRSMIMEKQPDYYQYLVFLFGFDPGRAPGASPMASAF